MVETVRTRLQHTATHTETLKSLPYPLPGGELGRAYQEKQSYGLERATPSSVCTCGDSLGAARPSLVTMGVALLLALSGKGAWY